MVTLGLIFLGVVLCALLLKSTKVSTPGIVVEVTKDTKSIFDVIYYVEDGEVYEKEILAQSNSVFVCDRIDIIESKNLLGVKSKTLVVRNGGKNGARGSQKTKPTRVI